MSAVDSVHIVPARRFQTLPQAIRKHQTVRKANYTKSEDQYQTQPSHVPFSRKLKCPSCREGVPVEVMDRRGVVRGAPSRGGKGERGGGGALHPGPRQQTLEPPPTCPPCPLSLSKGQTLSQVARLLVMKVTTPSQPARMLLVVERL